MYYRKTYIIKKLYEMKSHFEKWENARLDSNSSVTGDESRSLDEAEEAIAHAIRVLEGN